MTPEPDLQGGDVLLDERQMAAYLVPILICGLGGARLAPDVFFLLPASYFENDKKGVLEIQNQINITDKEIDQMVYKLYDLTPDEIKIVEGV